MSGYRVSAWFEEFLAEVVGCTCVLFAMSGVLSQIRARDFAAFAIGSITFFCVSGYAITTLIARLLLHGRGLYLYAAIAPLLFLAHFQVMNVLTWGGLFERHDRFLFRVYGCAMVLAVTTVVSLMLKRAEKRLNRQPPALPAQGSGETSG